MLKKWLYCCLLLFLIKGGELYAQTPNLHLQFARQNNFTYTTQFDFNYELEKGRYRMDMQFHHDHLLNSARQDDPFIQFYIRTSLWQYYDLSRRFALASWIESDQFFHTENQRYSLYLGAEYKPVPQVRVVPLLGYSWDYRDGRLDQGISPALKVGIRHKWDDGLQTETDIFLRYKNISPRQQRNLMLQNMWAYEVGDQAQISFGLKAGSNEIDDYRSGSVERIISDTLNPVLSLRYKVLPNWYWETANQILLSRRSFIYEPFETNETEFNSLRFSQTEFYTLQKLAYSKNKLRAYFSYEYEYIVRRYDLENSLELSELDFERLREREKQKDYLRSMNAFELFINYQLNKRHELRVQGSNRYLQYDTPNEDNFDDHDELNYGLGLEWKTRWSRKFQTSYKLSGQKRQYAFLFKERSQDNYTQRALRLEFGFQWEPLPRLSLKGEQDIYVTYNVKDFEDRNRTDRSTRNLESRLEARYRPHSKWNIETSYYRKETHVSYLNWELFTETTLDTNRIQIFEIKNTLRVKSPWKKARLFTDLGYKHFEQSRLQNTAMLDLENKLIPINLRIRTIQTGPQTGFRIVLRGGAGIETAIWWQYQIQDFRFQEGEKFLTLSASYRQRDLEEVKTAFRPFVSLKMNLLIK